MTKPWPHRSWSWPMRVGVALGAVAFLFVLGRVLVMTPSAEAHADVTHAVLYSFGSSGNTDGATPQGELIRDAAGNLYGTTYLGGARLRCGHGEGCGTVFKLDTTGREAVLYRFSREPDGLYPLAGLVRDAAGNLYGTTFYGGASNYGTVFKLDATGTETVLYSFTGMDGAFPQAGLIRDAAGNLYGTTSNGGVSNSGTVFKLDATGTETVLYSFTGMDGKEPVAELVRDAAGNLYGTTQLGGAFDRGTVFKLDTTGAETVLHSFRGRDGRYPYGDLVRDAAGNLYGTTYGGGASGQGTVFKVDGTGRETVLYSFTGQVDGGHLYAGLVRDPAGNLYGTTYAGGASNFGTVFKLDTTGAETVLYSFTGGADGSGPQAGLIRDAAGNLYGTTVAGGVFGVGTVFKLSFP